MADSAPTPRGSEQDKLQTSVEAVETKIVDDAKKAGIPSYQADSDTAAAERAAEPKEVTNIRTGSGDRNLDETDEW